MYEQTAIIGFRLALKGPGADSLQLVQGGWQQPPSLMAEAMSQS